MGLTINTNIFSLNAQRNLAKNQDPLQTTLQRLSSGFRINSARDDAAGFAITTRQTTQIRGLSVAIRNANDGISFAQTAEGALDEVINSLQRINELAIQAASNNTDADRGSLNDEVVQLTAELDRIVSQTRFNGETFLNQTKSINVQVGTAVNETINISTSNVAPTQLGVSTSYNNALTSADVAAAAFFSGADSAGLDGTTDTLGGTALTAITEANLKNNSLSVVNDINTFTTTTGISAFGFGNALVGGSAAVAATAVGNVDAGYLTINGVSIGSFAVTAGTSVTQANIAASINAKSATTGVSAYLVTSAGVTVDATSLGRIVLANSNGGSITVSQDANVSGATLFAGGVAAFAGGTTSVAAGTNGKIIFNADIGTTSATVGTTDAAIALGQAGSIAATTSAAVSLTQSTINSLSVTTAGNANVAILATSSAIDTISSEKARLGAIQNRLLSTVSNLENVRENASQARSRIKDADFAAETSELTKLLIIQQAGISVLSQANQLPQNVLALLQ